MRGSFFGPGGNGSAFFFLLRTSNDTTKTATVKGKRPNCDRDMLVEVKETSSRKGRPVERDCSAAGE